MSLLSISQGSLLKENKLIWELVRRNRPGKEAGGGSVTDCRSVLGSCEKAEFGGDRSS